MFRNILQNLCFLACQGLALRGHVDGEDSNFTQLLCLREFNCPEVTTWMDKKTNKYTSADIQNECLQVMALHILRHIGSSIRNNGVYTVMADECTDASNKEQFIVCIRWVDKTLIDHEDVACGNDRCKLPGSCHKRCAAVNEPEALRLPWTVL